MLHLIFWDEMEKEEFKKRLIDLCVEADVELYIAYEGSHHFQPKRPINPERSQWEIYIDWNLEDEIYEALDKKTSN